MEAPVPDIRVDKWLWQARFFKSRTLAGKHCIAGKVRLNGNRLAKAHASVRVGDVLTFAAGPHIRVVRIVSLGTRRGPASEACGLYDDLSPPGRAPSRPDQAATETPIARDGRREAGAGRPTKADRRAIDRLKGNPMPDSF